MIFNKLHAKGVWIKNFTQLLMFLNQAIHKRLPLRLINATTIRHLNLLHMFMQCTIPF
jgi:hypothetical protein